MFFRVAVIGLLMLLTLNCTRERPDGNSGSNNTTAGFANANNDLKLTGEIPAIDCSDPAAYDISVVDGARRTIDLKIGGKLVWSDYVPSQADSGISGFALNGVKRTAQGFDISIEFGSINYFSKRLIFECKKGSFYLTRIDVESFNKARPSKWVHKTVRVDPNVPLRKFTVLDHTTDSSNKGLYPE